MFNLLKKMIWLGAGLAVMTTEKIEAVVAELIKKGQLSEKEGKELAAELIARSLIAKKELGEKIDKIITDTLQRLNIPSRKDLEEIKARLERLEKEVGKKE
jgi:polyhydroxyalkanoate synthesis regulator phasin